MVMLPTSSSKSVPNYMLDDGYNVVDIVADTLVGLLLVTRTFSNLPSFEITYMQFYQFYTSCFLAAVDNEQTIGNFSCRCDFALLFQDGKAENREPWLKFSSTYQPNKSSRGIRAPYWNSRVVLFCHVPSFGQINLNENTRRCRHVVAL